MRPIARFLLLFTSIFVTQIASAASRFWVSAVTLNWSNTAGWAASSGGAPGATVPGSGDAVFFDGNGTGNCNGDIAVTITSITIGAGYTGTISQNANTIAISGAATLSGGIFLGGSANITVGGVFTLSGTALTSTSGVLELQNSAAFTSGTFAHNNGTVKFNCVNNAAQTITGNGQIFYTLEFAGIGRTYTMSALVGDITVMNSLNTSGTLFYNLAGGVIDVKGDINSNNTATGCGGDATININGIGTQNFNGGTASGEGALPQLTINKTTGTLNLTNFPGVSNNFTYTAGTVSAGTSTFCFTHGNVGAYTISGSLTLASISFPINTSLMTITIPLATTITATGDCTIAGAGNLVLNTGNINVSGNLVLTNTGNGGGGSATINIVGTGSENLDGSAVTVNQSRLPIININKISGTLSLLGNISFSDNLTYTAGTINAGTSTCYIVNNLTITGIFSVYNLSIEPAGNTTVTVASGSTITAANTLDLENGANLININTGTIAVQGNLVDNNTSLIGGGNGTILIDGSGAQSITSSGIINQGRLPAVTISKSGGTLIFPSLITVVGNWTYVSGTLDVTTNNSTVVFENALNITGTHTLNNIIFEGTNNFNFVTAVGTTVTVSGNISMIGTANITLNTGTYNLLGNLILSNTGGGGGTTVIDFIGTTNQAITSSLLINQNCLPSVTINKASGTLSFPALITVRGNWTYTTGTLDITTNNSTVVFADPLGSGVFSITGTHTLNNVSFEANNNNTLTIPTGTVLTISKTMTTLGTANMSIDATVPGTTVVQALGDIAINNTGAGGGGNGKILINGTIAQAFSSTVTASHGLLPYITIQKTSGTLTMSGIISVSRDWTYTSGTVDATTNASTVVFGGNPLSVTSAGMNFYNVTVAANTTTLLSAMTLNNNLTISGTAVLAPVANTINIGGSWNNYGTAGFTEATSTVNFNGTGLQTITTPLGENFNDLTINNSGAGIQMENNVEVATTMTMTQGNIDLNGNTLTLGLSAASNGTLSYTAGTIINTGSFVRWFKTATTIAAGSVNGLFPMGTAANYRPLFISAPVTGPTVGGTIAIDYTDATTNSTVSILDAPFTVVVRKDLNWQMTAGNGLTGGTYNMQIQGTGYGLIGAVSDLRITLAAAVVGIAGVNAGTVLNPQINRIGLTAANLSNTFYIGSINSVSSPLPVTLVSFSASPKNQSVDVKWETAIETQNDYFTVYRSRDANTWDSVTRVSGKGNSTDLSYYEVFDNNPYVGLSYYRLKNTDFDGTEYFSPIVHVTMDEKNSLINLFPNPAVSTVVVTSTVDPITAIRITGVSGQSIQVSVSPNSFSKTIDVSAFATGVYFVSIVHGAVTETRTIVIGR
jgi:hypothetical protein